MHASPQRRKTVDFTSVPAQSRTRSPEAATKRRTSLSSPESEGTSLGDLGRCKSFGGFGTAKSGEFKMSQSFTSFDDAKPAGEEMGVKVMARVRPFSSRELKLEAQAGRTPESLVFFKDNTVTVIDPASGESKDAFEFDEAFWSIPPEQNQVSSNPFATQEMVFDAVGRPAVESALSGYNCCIFAYGQTGSGKTHSMPGSEDDPGVTPRLVRRLFSLLDSGKDKSVSFNVTLSFMEIYNEKVKDLLRNEGCESPRKKAGKADEYKDCRVRFHPEYGTFVEGLTRQEITSADQCIAMMQSGVDHRTVAATNMNDTSSRSHAIFQLGVKQKDIIVGVQKYATINLVDLAGSERIKMSGVTGKELNEAKNINQSLSTLRRVIDTLMENSKLGPRRRKAVAPYRESLLTWVLSDSLGGNSSTAMLATVSPYHGNIEDTVGTLRYALKAKAIVCHVKVNEEKTAVVVGALKSEMFELKKKLKESANHPAQEDEATQLLKEEFAAKEKEYTRARTEQAENEKIGAQLRSEIARHQEEIRRVSVNLAPKLEVQKQNEALDSELKKAMEQSEQEARQIEEERRAIEAGSEQIYEAVIAGREMNRLQQQRRMKEEEAIQDQEYALQKQFTSLFLTAARLQAENLETERLKRENEALKLRLEELIPTLESVVSELDHEMSRLRAAQADNDEIEAACKATSSRIGDVSEQSTEQVKRLLGEKRAAEVDSTRCRQEAARITLKLDEYNASLDGTVRVGAHDIMELESDVRTTERELREVEDACITAEANTKVTHMKSDSLEKQLSQRTLEANLLGVAEDLQEHLDNAQESVDQCELFLESETIELEELEEEDVKLRNAADAERKEIDILHAAHQELKKYVNAKYFPDMAGSGGGRGGGSKTGAKPVRSVTPSRMVAPPPSERRRKMPVGVGCAAGSPQPKPPSH